jgi:hypothetical protein
MAVEIEASKQMVVSAKAQVVNHWFQILGIPREFGEFCPFFAHIASPANRLAFGLPEQVYSGFKKYVPLIGR